MPDPGVERNCVDNLGRVNFLEGIDDTALNIAKRSYRAGLLGACVVLIIAHDDHIVSKYALFLQVVVVVEVHWNIVVHGKDKSVLSAGNGHLSHELNEGLAILRCHHLKVQVDSVDSKVKALINHVVNDVRP